MPCREGASKSLHFDRIRYEIFKNKNQLNPNKSKESIDHSCMTNPLILRRKNLYHNITLKKQQPSFSKFIKRNKFLYINHQLFKSHWVFLHHVKRYIQNKSSEFDKEPLKTRAYYQKSTFNQIKTPEKSFPNQTSQS